VPRNRFGFCEDTSADGTYAISEIPPGEYWIEYLGKGNLLTEIWGHEGGAEHWSDGTPLLVELGDVKAGIDANLTQGARIEGNVRLAANGEPDRSLYACALRSDGIAVLCAQPKNSSRPSTGTV
jgi:hypothetical protein